MKKQRNRVQIVDTVRAAVDQTATNSLISGYIHLIGIITHLLLLAALRHQQITHTLYIRASSKGHINGNLYL